MEWTSFEEDNVLLFLLVDSRHRGLRSWQRCYHIRTDWRQRIEVWLLVRVGRHSHACTLDPHSMDVVSKTDLALEEHFVVVPTLIDSRSQPREPVKIELPLKTCHLRLLEILWHDVVHKLLCLVDNEASSVWLP